MYCNKCGSRLADSARYCTKCGAPRAAAAPAEKDSSIILKVLLIILVCIVVFALSVFAGWYLLDCGEPAEGGADPASSTQNAAGGADIVTAAESGNL